jgi:hypothetical protein
VHEVAHRGTPSIVSCETVDPAWVVTLSGHLTIYRYRTGLRPQFHRGRLAGFFAYYAQGGLVVAKTPITSLKQPLPRNSDGGNLPDEDVTPVAHRDC